MSDFREDILSFLDFLEENPERRKVTFKASARQLKRLQYEVKIQKFHSILDTQDILLQPTSGPNPLSLLLAALGASQEMTFRIFSEILNIPITTLDIDVEGDFDLHKWILLEKPEEETILSGVIEIRIKIKLESPINGKKLNLLIEKSKKHCPILSLISEKIPIKYIKTN